MSLLPDGTSVGDSFYFAVVTFLTIGYGDVHPASSMAKAFFMMYIFASLLVQLTVLASFVSTSLSFKTSHEPLPAGSKVRATL